MEQPPSSGSHPPLRPLQPPLLFGAPPVIPASRPSSWRALPQSSSSKRAGAGPSPAPWATAGCSLCPNAIGRIAL